MTTGVQNWKSQTELRNPGLETAVSTSAWNTLMFLKLGRLRATVGSWKVKDVIISFQLRFQLDQTAKYMFANEKKKFKVQQRKKQTFLYPSFSTNRHMSLF